MEIVMIKKEGCEPCKHFEPIVKNVSIQNKLNFKIVKAEEMPENMRPDIFPFFYLLRNKELVESWAGTNERKMQKVLNRHISNFKL